MQEDNFTATDLPHRYLEYRAGVGSTDEVSARYLDSLLLRPRMLPGVPTVDTSRTLFGKVLPFPMMIAPIAFHCLWHPEGEVESAARAAEHGMGYCYNATYASRSYRSLKEGAPEGYKLLHLYLWKERDMVEELLRKGQESDLFSGLVLTVDHPHNRVKGFIAEEIAEKAWRYRHPSEPTTLPNLQKPGGGSWSENIDPTITLNSTLEWFQERTNLPIILKGVLTAEDAQVALEHKVQGLFVSNHGGRQIDGAVPSTLALTEIVKVVNRQVPIIVDSGIRHSVDIVRALCLGADAVMMGRVPLRAMARGCLGPFLQDLRFQFECDLMSLGCRTLDDLGPHLLHRTTH